MSVYIIKVDETPQPWEDHFYVYCVVIGAFEKCGEVFNQIEADHPEWIVNFEEVEHIIDVFGSDTYGETFGKCRKCGLNITNVGQHRLHCKLIKGE